MSLQNMYFDFQKMVSKDLGDCL